MFLDHSAPSRGKNRETKIFKANRHTYMHIGTQVHVKMKNSSKNKNENNDKLSKNDAKTIF